jgi:hypothetical protein
MYALDMQQKILEPLSPMTQSSLLSFAELFSFMMSEGGEMIFVILGPVDKYLLPVLASPGGGGLRCSDFYLICENE